MKSQLSGAEFARIMPEICSKCPGHIHSNSRSEHESEALAEIENHLQFIDPCCNSRYHNAISVGKDVFTHGERFKTARGLK